MNFLRLSERQWVTLGIYVLAVLMLAMATLQPSLWDVELFKVLLQAVLISGLINQVLAFHFAANKADEDKTNNTGAAFRAIEATAKAGNAPTDENAIQEGDTVTIEKAP